MRKLRKTLSFVIVLSFMLSISVGAFAAEIAIGDDGQPTNQAGGEGWSYEGSDNSITLSSGEHSLTGGSFNGDLFISEGAILTDGKSSGYVENSGTIENGTFSGYVKNNFGSTIDGGEFTGANYVQNLGTIKDGSFTNHVSNLGTIENGSFTGSVSNDGLIENGSFTAFVGNNTSGSIGNGSFTGDVINNGCIEDGTFSGTVDNLDIIEDGSFSGHVINNSIIDGGSFSGSVNNNDSGSIEGGSFTDTVYNFDGSITGGSFSSNPMDPNGNPIQPGQNGFEFSLISGSEADTALRSVAAGENGEKLFIVPMGTVAVVWDDALSALLADRESGALSIDCRGLGITGLSFSEAGIEMLIEAIGSGTLEILFDDGTVTLSSSDLSELSPDPTGRVIISC